MVKYFVLNFFLIFLCLKNCVGSPNVTEKSILKRQTDSFVVSANYGVQSGSSNNLTTSQHLDNSKDYRSPDIYEQYERPPPISSNFSWTPPQSNFQVSDYSQTKVLYEGHDNSEALPSPSAWTGSNLQNFANNDYNGYEGHLQRDPAIYVTSAYQPTEIQSEIKATSHPYARDSQSYGLSDFRSPKSDTGSQIVKFPTLNTLQSHERADELNEILSDTHKPTVQDLQQIISKIVKGATKVHQVVKVPAVYEIHLQEEVKSGTTADDSKSFQVPLPQWETYHSVEGWQSANKPVDWKMNPRPLKKPLYPRGNSNQITKTWNLPSKIRYFNKKPLSDTSKPIYGKYPHPKPFNKWESFNNIPLKTWSYPKYSSTNTAPIYYGSVSVPITPGSTAVTLLNHSTHIGNPNVYSTFSHSQSAAPDLSLYYAKKQELENQGFHSINKSKYGYRRNDRIEAKRDRINYRPHMKSRYGGQRMYSPFNGIDYIIHVREKPRK